MIPPDLAQYTLITQHLVMAQHLNPNHHIFGGQLTAWLDEDLYVFACAQLQYKRLVTLAMDDIRFRNPANLGDILRMYGRIKAIGRTSVTVDGKILAFDPERDTYREIISCEIVYVALNADGRPTKIPVPAR